MSELPGASPESSDPREYLVVDDFIRDLVGARALKSALGFGLIDRLSEPGSVERDELERIVGADASGFAFLLDLLLANSVIEEESSRIRLTDAFRTALRYRDLLEVKLDFAGFVIGDFVQLFDSLIADPPSFQQGARLFELFDYSRCVEPTPENYEHTQNWVRLTTTLTKYEARACLPHHDFGRYARLLDIGGNSGEFSLQLCRQHPNLRATVFDLPVVTEIARDHLLREPEHDRISFIAGNALEDTMPKGFDLITFKSVLHDWPDSDARQLLAKAADALEPGGTLLIYEREPLRAREHGLPFSMLPILLFFRFYRGAGWYEAPLKELGFDRVEVRQIELETPFFLLTARKTAA